MNTKNESARSPSLALRRPSAAPRVRVEAPKPAPEPEPVAVQTNEAPQAPEPKPAPVPETVAAPTIEAPPTPVHEVVAAPTIEARRTTEPKLSREAGRIEAEPEADFFVSIPKSKKNALKVHCAQAGISMRDWLLRVLDEKGIGTADASKRGQK